MNADELMRRADLIKKIIEEENDLSLEIKDKDLFALLDKKTEETVITSDDLKTGDSKNIIFYESAKDIDDDSLLSVLDKHLDKDKYDAFHIVVLVHSVKDKIHVSDIVKEKVDKKRRENKKDCDKNGAILCRTVRF